MKSQSDEEARKLRRWPGVLFSFLVPGFGLIRSGNIRRGLIWFVGLTLGQCAFAVMLALESIPMFVVAAVFAALLAAGIWMVVDSFRPGRMTPWLWCLFFGALVALVLVPEPTGALMDSRKIPTSSMEPTFRGARNGTPDHVVVDKLTYRFRKPQRGDIAVFRASPIPDVLDGSTGGEQIYFKRVVGLPGETIELRDGSIYADGRVLGKEDGIPPVKYLSWRSARFSGKRSGEAYVLGEDEYFVLGDNSENSSDSRDWGYVPASAIFGKVTRIYYPFSRIGNVPRPDSNIYR